MTRNILAATGVSAVMGATIAAAVPGAIDGASWAEQHAGILMWGLAVMFSTVLFFVRSWMTRRERSEEEFRTATTSTQVRIATLEERQTAHLEKMAAAIEHIDHVVAAHLEDEPKHWAEVLERIGRIEGEQGRVRDEHVDERRARRPRR